LERVRAVLKRHARGLGLTDIPSPTQNEPDSWDQEAVTLVPGRMFPGPVSPGAYFHRLSSVEREEAHAWQKAHPGHGRWTTVADYWVDGKRSVAEIADLVELETGRCDVQLLVRHFKLLARLELMSLHTVAAQGQPG
jgi:hypothetical protein